MASEKKNFIRPFRTCLSSLLETGARARVFAHAFGVPVTISAVTSIAGTGHNSTEQQRPSHVLY